MFQKSRTLGRFLKIGLLVAFFELASSASAYSENKFKGAARYLLQPSARAGMAAPSSEVLDRVLMRLQKIQPGIPMSPSQLNRQAELLGLQSGLFNGARMDSRSPGAIIEAGGFFPNPYKKSGSILGHVHPGSQGTSNLVSFTESAGRRELAVMDFFYQQNNYVNALPAGLRNLPAELASQDRFLKRLLVKGRFGNEINKSMVNVSVARAFEYELQNVSAVIIPGEFLGAQRAIAAEAERVAGSIPLANITGVREVYRVKFDLNPAFTSQFGIRQKAWALPYFYGAFSPLNY